MAGSPEVKVRIKADSTLNEDLKSAHKSIGSLVESIPVVGLVAGAAGAAIAAFAKGAVDEAAKAELGMARLGNAVGNAGGDFRKLSPEIEATVSKVMKLSTATDDDLRAALTNMITISGDVSGSMKNLGLVTDVAAYSGKSLEESANLVGKAMTGNVKALSQFGNEVKNAKDPMEALRLTVSGFAEKEANTFTGSLQQINNQWGEFQEAVGNAILGGGEASTMADGLAGYLAELVIWVEKNEDSFAEFSFALLTVVQSLGATLKGLSEFPGLGPTIGLALKGISTILVGLGALFQRTGGIIYEFGAKAVGNFATIVQAGGKLLKVFGIEAGETLARSLTATAEQMKAKSEAMLDASETGFFNGMQRIWDKEVYFARKGLDRKKDEIRETVAVEKDGQDKVTRVHEEGGEKRLTKAQEKAELMKYYMSQANEIFAATTRALEESTRPTLRDMKADWSAIDEKVKAAAASIGITTDAQKELAEAGESVRKKQLDILDEAEATKEKFRQQVDEVSSIAGSMLGIATSAGVLDEKAANTLQSVLKMGTDLAKFGFTSPQGILSVINGLSQLIGGWGSSAAEQERKKALEKNTRAMEELSRDIGEYTGSASGRTFQGVTSVLGDIFKDFPQGRLLGDAELSQMLSASGLGITLGDAKKLAERYGIDTTKGNGWFQLFQILKTRQFGAPGNFTDELDSLEDSFGVLGIDDADDQLSQFGAFLDKHVPALKGTLSNTSTKAGRDAAIAKLKALYTASVTGKIAPGEYGKASPPQFRQIISTLLKLLGNADGFLSTAQPTEPTPAPNPTGGGTLPSGPSKDTRPIGGVGTSGLISGGVTPTVGAGSGSFVGLELGGATIGTQNNTVTLHVQAHPDESAAIYAERVAALVSAQLGQKYKTQRAALGLV